MRGTTHNGRAGKNGVYSPKHNDRNFESEHADHIDRSQSNNNWYWHMYSKENPDMTFEDVERKFYEEHFKDNLTVKNERYRKAGHKERMKTMDEYRSGKRTCPEEIILQVGKVGETIDPNLLKKICIEHVTWQINTYPNVKVLNTAMHVDEEGAPHVHVRQVWVGESNDGLVVSQSKALEEMGIERPHPEKKRGKYNNSKMTFTKACREHFFEVCLEHGLELEKEPNEVSKSGLDLQEYKCQQEKEKLEQINQKKNELIKQCRMKESELNSISEDIDTLNEINEETKERLRNTNTRLHQAKEELEGARINKKQIDEKIEQVEKEREWLCNDYEVMFEQHQQKQRELKKIKDDIEKGENLIREMREIKPRESEASTRMRTFMSKRYENGRSLFEIYCEEQDREFNMLNNLSTQTSDFITKTPDKQSDWDFAF